MFVAPVISVCIYYLWFLTCSADEKNYDKGGQREVGGHFTIIFLSAEAPFAHNQWAQKPTYAIS